MQTLLTQSWEVCRPRSHGTKTPVDQELMKYNEIISNYQMKSNGHEIHHICNFPAIYDPCWMKRINVAQCHFVQRLYLQSYLVTLTELVFFLEISVGSPASLKKIWAERYSEHLRASLQPNLKCYSKAIQCCPHPATFAIKSSSHFSIGICDFFNTTLLFIATSCSLWLCSLDTASCL